MKLIKRTEIDKPLYTYNLHIENDHNYVATGAVVSNCHQAKADVLRRLLTQNFANIPIRWGITGTIPKEDFNQHSLITSIGPVVNTVRASDLQEQGILSTCHIHICQFYDLMVFKKYPDEHRYLVTDKTRVQFMANMISKIATTGNTLVLVSLIDTGDMLQEMIADSVFIHGVVKSKDRKEEYDAFETENSKILIATYGVAAVGINIVSLYNVVLIEPGKSFVKVIQSIGRGLRKGFDKDHVDIWDFSSTCKFSKRHLTERKRYYKEANYKYTIQKLDWR
jgi:superfamily II DNA or RNA helicase